MSLTIAHSVNAMTKNMQTLRIDTDTKTPNEHVSTPSTSSEDNDNSTVYRYKLSTHVVESVTSFTKMHQYDSRKDYKEAWVTWADEQTNMISSESMRLKNLGYDGDVLDKMYKAGRYYFRTKTTDKSKKPKKRRQYISMDNTILSAMDAHIADNASNDTYSPANGYDNFVSNNTNILRNEINRIILEKADIKASDIALKIKKTYKNRYYLYSRTQN